MTSIERAKRFIQGKGRTLALGLVPLASLSAISVPARAGTVGPATVGLVFDTNTCGVGLSGGIGSGTCTVTQLPAQGGVTGLTLSGTASGTSSNSGGGFFIGFNVSGGTNGGSFGPGTIPLHYDFTVTNSDGNPVDYTLILDFQTNVGPLEDTFSGSGIGDISGSPSATIPGAVTVDSYSIDFAVTDPDVGPNGTTMSVNIPAGTSIDLNAASTPEPSTLALVGSAIAGLMWWRRKKA